MQSAAFSWHVAPLRCFRFLVFLDQSVGKARSFSLCSRFSTIFHDFFDFFLHIFCFISSASTVYRAMRFDVAFVLCAFLFAMSWSQTSKTCRDRQV